HLASYPHLQPFPQFPSHLHQTTQPKLNPPPTTLQLLKQHFNKPLKLQKQLPILYPLTTPYLHHLPLPHLKPF
ncbi:hypothetical protein, partial [Bacillus pumilus]|uniref:hypothetical protein n=1 Tax=Bacillus pumilus TaxID=1408 RepID=UPI003F689ABE